MTQAVQSILDAALPLSSHERAEIIARLLQSLDGPTPTAQEQAEIDEAWMVEARRRLNEIDDGTARLIPGEEFMAKLRRLGTGGERR